MIHRIAGMVHLKCIISKLCWSINFGPLNAPKTVDEWHEAWKHSSHPRTNRSPADKVKYRCKFCEMLLLDKLALFFQILAIFSTCLVLKHFQKWSLKLQTTVTNQWKATGLVMPPEVCVESEIWMYNLWKRWVFLAYAGYISKIFTLFPLLAYKLLLNTT